MLGLYQEAEGGVNWPRDYTNRVPTLFDDMGTCSPGHYRPVLTATKNRKGVLDVDTVKGCTLGMMAYPRGGCYGECYAQKNAALYGFDFSVSVTRKLFKSKRTSIFSSVKEHPATWYRIGTAGDPCHDWDNTISVCEELRYTGKIPVIVTKHWVPLTDEHILRLKALSAVVNTSTSGQDRDDEIRFRVGQMTRLKSLGVKSVCRVVTCRYGDSRWARECKTKQDYLLSLTPVIDNPLRASKLNPRVVAGDIITTIRNDSIGGGKLVSVNSSSVYLGRCKDCPDQCGSESIPYAGGANMKEKRRDEKGNIKKKQGDLFNNSIEGLPIIGIRSASQKVEFTPVESVLGSGYEENIAKLAIEDGIAKRAARKNMQIHSAIILKINGEFCGFFTFQNNDECGEFCLLQSVIRPDLYTDELYREMVIKVIEQNINGFPALITTDPRSKFETPKLFESLGFQTYLKMSGFCYMVKGELSSVRMKLLAHITMTNVWNSTKGDWLRLKKEWNALIEKQGEKHSIPNPTFASREGCWQGESGFSQVVNTKRSIDEDGNIKATTKAHNANASVLDPVACEIILRFFIPKNGRRIYNPFGGGVQFGFISGFYGYEYIASEIRQNQCDVNNKLCSDFKGVKWIKSDSSIYKPKGAFDLVFTCPPYYRVEKYVDYGGVSPEGEINSFGTYDEFRDALFKGYKIAIDKLNDNCFFVIMVGDSRDKKGSYYGVESETEQFLKKNGLSIYNKIVYLESEFTRLAQAKKTLNQRKFPKREQKIIVAFKGNASSIKDLYSPLGRL
jgi:hypothetical protein